MRVCVGRQEQPQLTIQEPFGHALINNTVIGTASALIRLRTSEARSELAK
jgi:hypothetical protein